MKQILILFLLILLSETRNLPVQILKHYSVHSRAPVRAKFEFMLRTSYINQLLNIANGGRQAARGESIIQNVSARGQRGSSPVRAHSTPPRCAP